MDTVSLKKACINIKKRDDNVSYTYAIQCVYQKL